jgi:hypothetical protein
VPLRDPFREAKKLLYEAWRSRREDCRTTAETSPSHARSGVFFASVITVFAGSAIDGTRCPCRWASWRMRTASFHATRAHPNAFANSRC